MILRATASALAGLFIATTPAIAQGDASGPHLPAQVDSVGPHSRPVVSAAPLSLTVWGGRAQNSPGNLWGAESGRDVSVLAVRLAQPVVRTARLELDYVLDIVPAAWVSMPSSLQVLVPCNRPKPGSFCIADLVDDRGAARAFGVAPLGFQLRLRPASRVQPYVTIGGGMLRFERETPVPGSARVNFTADLGGGVLLQMPQGLGVMLGYKFYHISNAGTAAQNPGIDSHMLVLGLRRAAR